MRVRAILAEEIKHLDCMPKRRRADAGARSWKRSWPRPILEYSPLLSDADLIEIIACGQVQEVLTAIARRKPLSEKVSDALVQSLDVSGGGGAAGQSGRQDPQGRRWTASSSRPRRSKAWHHAAGVARRSVRPRHPAHRQLCRRRLLEQLAARDDL